jgi:hypothetical protein
MILNTEKTVASVQVNADMTTVELDALLRKLALLRADMTPPVPMDRDEQFASQGALLEEDQPELFIASRRSGGFRLWARHRGYGWLGYQITDTTAATVANYITSKVAPTGVNLVSDDLGKAH